MKYVSTTLVKQVDKEIKFTKDSHGYGTINVWNLMQCLALDVIGETAFGQTFHMVENGTHPVPSIIAFRMKVGAYVMAYPSLAKLVLTGEPDPRLVSVCDATLITPFLKIVVRSSFYYYIVC
jgi:hypothetical protein